VRTTLTLDDDVAVRLEREVRKRGDSFKAVVNDLLRAGLEAAAAKKRKTRAFRTEGVPDAHLAGLAIEHGLTLCSSDGDFAKFPQLKWENPLARN
jgi:predicted nucleic acid-binding protein